MAYDSKVSIIVLGESGVGKSSLLLRFAKNIFKDHLKSTIIVDSYHTVIYVKNKRVLLELWDTGGQERHKCIVNSYFRKADGVLLVYDVTDLASFDNLKSWFLKLKDENETAISILVGNKTDHPKGNAVEASSVTTFAREHNLVFYECSAKTGENVTKIFEGLTERVLESNETYLTEMELDSKETSLTERGLASNETYFTERGLQSQGTYLTGQVLESNETYLTEIGLQAQGTYLTEQVLESNETYLTEMGLQAQGTYLTEQVLESNETYLTDRGLQAQETIPLIKPEVPPIRQFSQVPIDLIPESGKATTRNLEMKNLISISTTKQSPPKENVILLHKTPPPPKKKKCRC